MTGLNVWMLLLLVIGVVAALYILYLKVQLAFYKHYTVVVTLPVQEPSIGCLGAVMALLAVLATAAILRLVLAP